MRSSFLDRLPRINLVDGSWRALLATLALVVAVAVTAVVLLLPDDPAPTTATEPPAPPADPPTTSAAPFRAGEPPDALVVPSIDLDAPLVPIEVTPDGVLTPPDDTDIVGWWKRSAQPGAPVGQTVLTGHTVHTGGGVMNELGELEPGATVQVRDDGHTVDFEVTKVFVYSRAEVAENAQTLFGQGRRGGRLVLVTCTDWNGTDYDSNIIVFGEPVDDAVADAA